MELTSVEGYLKGTAAIGGRMEKFLLRRGVEMPFKPFPAILSSGSHRACYDNAFRLAESMPDLKYCEGVAYNIMPLPHAWCLDSEGFVVDPTWVTPISRREYVGVVLNTSLVQIFRKKHLDYGVLDGCLNLGKGGKNPERFLEEFLNVKLMRSD